VTLVAASAEPDVEPSSQAAGSVTVKFFADLAQVFGKEHRGPVGPATDVAGLLGGLCDTEGRRRALFDGDALRERLTVLVNGRNILFLDGLSTTLHDGDVVSVFPPVYGG
jgi:molybdopterin synthase sulfur carrier subunit